MNHVHYDSMAYYGNNILLWHAADIPHLDNHTKIYLQELSTLTSSLPDHAQHITLEEYTIEVIRIIEVTSLVPSDVNPAMIKTEVLYP